MISDYYTQNVSVITLTTATWGSSISRTTAATFKAAVNPYGKEVYIGDKKTVVADYKMYCPSTVSISERQLVRWDSKDFDVIFVKDTFQMGHHKNVLLKRQS